MMLAWTLSVLALICAGNCLNPNLGVTKTEAMNYLHKYGYIDDVTNMSDNRMRTATKEFQKYTKLPMTGELDAETRKMMRHPRYCDAPDKPRKSRSKRHNVEGRQQRKKFLLCDVRKYSGSSLTKCEIDKLTVQALNEWSKYSDVTLSIGSASYADIDVTYVTYLKDQILGQTYPHNGSIMMNDNVPWDLQDLYATTLHELGHSLGLDHTDVQEAAMYSYGYYFAGPNLHDDDIQAIRAIYGPNMDDSLSNKHICMDPKIDAIFRLPNGTIYIVKEHLYWVHDGTAIVGGSRLLCDTWTDLPGKKMDAAFTYKNNKTYMFRRKFMWKFEGAVKIGKSKLISRALNDIPDNIDAAIGCNTDKICFFKGDQFWSYDPSSKTASPPLKLTDSDWKGVPSDLDAALNLGRFIYFFKDTLYYKYNVKTSKVEAGYPKSTAKHWFNCN